MVSTTLHTVTGLHGPAYDAGNYPLKDYDIVIWMTGYETSNTITSTDMANLDRFLDENRTLWLISEGALNDPGFDLTWAKNRLMVDTANPVDTGPEDPLIGNDNHSITNGMVYNTTVRGPYSRGDYFTVDALGEELFTDATGDVNAATYNQSHWSVFFSFEFSKIRYPADQAALAYNVLRWLGGLQVRSGEDIAIAQIGVTPQSPAYKDDITISAILRNNGANGWDVPAAFYIDGMRLSTNDPRVNASMTVEEVQLNPGEAKEVTITLMADLDPGYHQLRVVADPGNTIAETNELNNEISSDNPIFNLTIYVKYTLLIVDDDESANNGGVLYNTTSNITDSIDTLGYDYTLYTVPLGLRGPEINLVERFKALIWICGEATTNTIMLEDQNVIRNYIENKSGQLWMMGQGILEEISPGDGATSEWFARDILHIAEVYHDVGISDPIQGVLYNEITHGMKYQMDDTDVFADAGDRIVPDSEATGVFWQDESQSHYCTISWESTVTASRIVFMPWEYAFINGLYERPLSFTRAGSRALAWEDDFETGDWSGGPWTENDPGNKLNVNAGGAHTGLFGVEYKGGGGDSQMWTGDIDLSVCTGATLFFNWSCNKMDAGEYVALSLSDDGGGTWNPISSISGGTGVWTPVIQDISAYLVNNMQIMISFSADSAAEAGGVDEFYIDGVGAAGAGPACYDLIVDPDPTNESASVTLYASADAGAGFFVDDIHYWSDVFPAPTSMTPDTPPFGDFQVEDGHVVVDISDWSTWTNGTHTFSVMALDDMGTWGLVSQVNFEITRDSPATSAVSTAPDPTNEALSIDLTATVTDQWSIVQAAEWWWDHVGDAGAGSNHAMAAQDGAFDSLSEVVEATVVSLAPGVYRIFVRGQDANGYWNITGPSAANASTYVDVTVSTSPPITSNVEVSPNPVNSMDSWIHVTANVSDGNSLVIAAEAYIDTDPGEGAATPLTVPAHVLADYPIMVHGDLSISGFSLGNHRVYVRAQQASDGAWGPVSSRLFTITKPDTTGPDVLVATVTPNPTEGALTAVLTAVVRDVQSTVAAAEYFVGTIGSHGSGIALDPTDDLFNSNTEDVNITIDISTWDYGEYQLWILGKDSLNQWSPPISVTLTVSKPPVEEALSARRELAFHVFKFFSHPEERPELRVVSVDLNISGKSPLEAVHPMLDGTYLVSTEVFNNGGVDATATVKLLDGDNLISTQTLVLPAYQKTHVEGIWTPLAVGPREIIVQVTQDSREAFDFNNGAYRSLYTYFFYDDMEEGADKWEHDDTVLLINGEGPLEFLADPMNTTITDSFNDTLGFEWTTDSYHSLPQSIYAEESDRPLPGTGVSVILGLVIDNSVSMTSRLNSTGANWLDVAKEAAINLVDSLAEDSAVCVWAFSGANPLQVQPLTVLSGGGREAVITAIDGMTDGQATQIWDATGFAYTEVNNGLAIYPDLNPAVVVLSDGADYHSNDQSAFGAAQVSKLESASHEWCPWHGMDDGVVIYTEHRGKYPISYLEYGPGGSVSEHGRWWTVPIGNPNRDRFGLLNSTMPIYTIGLALEHYDDPSGASNTTAVWPGEGVFDDLALYTGDLATYPEAGTMEYNLWKIANTSGAEYFYSPTSDMLIEIFQDISEAIGSGVVTRSGEATRAATTECFAETETFSLAGVDDATLSFYHKYDLVMGMNGGVVMVGNSTDGVSFQYRYLIPKESYPGNLNLGDTVYDGQGRVVRWCYNGVSAGGTFGWEHSEVDLSYFAGSEYVRVMFMYYEYGGGGGGGWWLDDIKVAVSRGNSVSVTTDAWDQWELSTSDSVSGQYSWCNNDPRGYFKGGLDNSLYTQPIDLTNALHATMSAYFKFNINATGARPPDTFRVEVSSNNGVTWYPLNLGVRAAKGVSGSGTDMDDGVLDNKTYTGIDPDGDGWIEAGTLTRLNVDLSGWVGKAIIMRFRMVTPSDDNSYFGSAHYEQDPASLGWGGFYMDDVVISGRSITGG
ncbi:MAG: VWA domain-containing protein [Thermoplasmata archaeon]|nr:VWA domain-containing protein [Thermoplasmata archaeon]